MEEILDQSVSELPGTLLQVEFDKESESVFDIAKQLRLSKKDIGFIKACECGGGQPNIVFFRFESLKEKIQVAPFAILCFCVHTRTHTDTHGPMGID